ncbi:hypothetical protein [Brumimicrobium aurantiacum]|uniref:Exo-alpha-sialidase n=1 Tax=Brumimicrobium aurantiacum TaxID=1737063 RepID=A0A3E1EVD4_9FLAO|nr:hypothetical protein [Brumimicrobium aurantiacum]RFC53526.1 hypothetical protein DXU93_12230 [Brumimicrobium aurantiacum]
MTQFNSVFEIPSNFSGFDTKAFETNDNGQLMIVSGPYDGNPTTVVKVYNSVDYGQSWDSTLFLNQSMKRDNACVAEERNL